MPSNRDSPISPAEAAALFHDLQKLPAIVLAVSGGPDSTALMVLVARWRTTLKRGPKLIAATVDHGLRRESAAEAKAVARLARKFGIAHRTLRWTGKKPATGLQQAARLARYRLLAETAKRAGAPVIVTAHTLDDQAETVLIRLTRGSGLTGLAGMRRASIIPGRERSERTRNDEDRPILLRPLLTIPKSRLIATLAAANIRFAEDPSNRDPRFTRARLRELMPKLAQEGLDARRLALLAERLGRAEAALSQAAAAAYKRLATRNKDGITLPAAEFMGFADDIGLRLLGRAVGEAGDEGPVELGKLEALYSALKAAHDARARFRRSLAGAIVTLNRPSLAVERAPPRRSGRLTTRAAGPPKGPKKR